MRVTNVVVVTVTVVTRRRRRRRHRRPGYAPLRHICTVHNFNIYSRMPPMRTPSTATPPSLMISKYVCYARLSSTHFRTGARAHLKIWARTSTRKHVLFLIEQVVQRAGGGQEDYDEEPRRKRRMAGITHRCAGGTRDQQALRAHCGALKYIHPDPTRPAPGKNARVDITHIAHAR